MRTVDAILPDVLPALPSVPLPRLERALIRAAQQLCRRARVWRVWTEPTLVQGPGEYDVDVPMHAQVEVLEAMTVNGRARQMLPWGFAPAAPEDAAGGHVVPGRVVFHVAEGGPLGQVRFRAVLLPVDGAPGLPDEVFDPYSALLALGVQAICMADRDRPWTDLQMAAALAQEFAAGVSQAATRAWRGYTDGTRRARIGWC